MSRKVALFSLWGAAAAVVVGTGAAAVALAQGGPVDRVLSVNEVLQRLDTNEGNASAISGGATGTPVPEPTTRTPSPARTTSPGNPDHGSTSRTDPATTPPRTSDHASNSTTPAGQSPAPVEATSASNGSVILTGGGMVVARCGAGTPQLLSWSPAPGYQVSKVQRGSSTALVEFRGSRVEVDVQVGCAGSRVTAAVKTEPIGGGSDDDSPPPGGSGSDH